MTNEVVLVPGLWVPAAVMTLLAARLARSGYVTRGFGYRGRGLLIQQVGLALGEKARHGIRHTLLNRARIIAGI